MQYTSLESGNVETKQVYVPQSVDRAFNVNSYFGMIYDASKSSLILSSTMFALDVRLTDGSHNWNTPNKTSTSLSEQDNQLKGGVLKGGSTYQLSTELNNKQQVTVTTVEMIADGSDYDSNEMYSHYGAKITAEDSLRDHNNVID